MDIGKDFEVIFVVGTSKSELTKKDIFRQILSDNQYTPEDVLVIGDDLDSEIKAANDLCMDAILYNHAGEQPGVKGQKTIHSFKDLTAYLD